MELMRRENGVEGLLLKRLSWVLHLLWDLRRRENYRFELGLLRRRLVLRRGLNCVVVLLMSLWKGLNWILVILMSLMKGLNWDVVLLMSLWKGLNQVGGLLMSFLRKGVNQVEGVRLKLLLSLLSEFLQVLQQSFVVFF